MSSHLQGGLVPSAHTVVVPLLCGTTTVVLFSGGGALLLLMQADRLSSMPSEAKAIFMLFPSCEWMNARHFDGMKNTCLSSRNGTAGQFPPTFSLFVGRARALHFKVNRRAARQVPASTMALVSGTAAPPFFSSVTAN